MSGRRQCVTLLALIVLVVSGCAGPPSQSGSNGPDTPTPSGEVLTVSTANQTRAVAAGPPVAVSFEDLSADRRDEFLAALDGDVRDPAQWGPGTDVQYVRYEGTWYFVTVVVEN